MDSDFLRLARRVREAEEAADGYLLKNGGTVTGNLTMDRDKNNAVLSIDSDAGYVKAIQLLTGGKRRWVIEANSDPESGSNDGSNLCIRRYDDAGNYLGTPVAINRATGVISTAGPISTHYSNAVAMYVGNDAAIADRDRGNTMFLEGLQNADRGYINFSRYSGNALGAVNGGNLTWRGNRVWDAAGLPYEAGTWSPGISGDGNWVGAAIAWRSGKYTRVGNIVHLTGRVGLSSKNGMTGGVLVGNFPFPAAAQAAGVIGFATNGSSQTFTLHLDSGVNFAYVLKYSQTKLDSGNISDSFYISGLEITYHIA